MKKLFLIAFILLLIVSPSWSWEVVRQTDYDTSFMDAEMSGNTVWFVGSAER